MLWSQPPPRNPTYTPAPASPLPQIFLLLPVAPSPRSIPSCHSPLLGSTEGGAGTLQLLVGDVNADTGLGGEVGHLHLAQ